MSAQASKISATFASRIKARPPKEPVRVVLLLNFSPVANTASRATTARTRKQVAASVIGSVQDLLPKVDGILSKHHGRRLSSSPDAFGSIAVESTPAGIMELAKQSWTRSIMEDQRIAAVI